MKQYTAKNIRNIVVAGHAGAGKTSLVEAAYYLTANPDRLGRVADGNTVSDFDSEEIRRKASVSTAECFKGFDLLPKEAQAENVGKTEACIEGLLSMDEAAVGQSLANDLYKAASTLNEEVEKTLNEARSFSPLGAVMTGSGSGVLALFETKELCEWAKSRYRGNAETVVVKTVVK